MVELVQIVNVSELTTVRITCKKCGMVWELPIEKLSRFKTEGGHCHYCDHDLKPTSSSGEDPYRLLSQAVQQFQEHEGVKVDFLIRKPAE